MSNEAKFHFSFIIVIVFCQQFHFNFNWSEFPLNTYIWWCRVDFELVNGYEMSIMNDNLHEKCNWKLLINNNIKIENSENKKIICHLIFVMMRADISSIPAHIHFNSSVFLQCNLYIFSLCAIIYNFVDAKNGRFFSSKLCCFFQQKLQ